MLHTILKKKDSGRPALAHRTRNRWVQASRNDTVEGLRRAPGKQLSVCYEYIKYHGQ